MTEGIIVINKPQNKTSHDVVSAVRRKLGIRRVGHTGTLDPMATGVLPVCVGRAARIMEYLDLDWKTYRCTMVLGIRTDTQDIWGTVLEEREVNVSEEQIREAFGQMDGVICQIPPMYSALKVNGKRLYAYAREGQTVEVQPRRVCLKDMRIEDLCLARSGEGRPSVTFTVSCTKGTYIRTICEDMGQKLGCLAAMSGLARVGSGVFKLDQAIDLADFEAMEPEAAAALLQPAWTPLAAFGKAIVCREQSVWAFSSGMPLPMDFCRIERWPVYADRDFPLPMREEFRRAYTVFGKLGDEEVFLGVAFHDKTEDKLVTDKVFFSRETK